RTTGGSIGSSPRTASATASSAGSSKAWTLWTRSSASRRRNGPDTGTCRRTTSSSARSVVRPIPTNNRDPSPQRQQGTRKPLLALRAKKVPCWRCGFRSGAVIADMGHRTLRACLADLERTGQLVRLNHEVDPYLEAAEIHRRVYQAGG